MSSQAVGRVAVKVTGDVGSCSLTAHPCPCSCHYRFTSFDFSLPHWSLIAPVGQVPPLAPFELLSHLSKASWSHRTLKHMGSRGAGGPLWFPQTLSPGLLNLCPASGCGSWASSLSGSHQITFQLRNQQGSDPFPLHHAVRGGSDRTSETLRLTDFLGSR